MEEPQQIVQYLQKIAKQPFSYQVLHILKALQPIQLRYPKIHEIIDATSPELIMSSSIKPIPEMKGPWRDVVASYPLSRAFRGPLDTLCIEPYLHLFRPSQHFRLGDIRETDASRIDIPDNASGCPLILPILRSGRWAFAVVYSDCVHWFDSSRTSDDPNSIFNSSKPVFRVVSGPQESNPDDSAIFMLIGIRCIWSGWPLLDQVATYSLVQTFRDRMFIEISCQKLDPDEDEIEALLHNEENESFTDSPPMIINHWPPLAVDVDQRLILHHLSEAVLTTRSSKVSDKTDLATLWQIMQKSGKRSTFHERYYAVLFYEMMQGISDIDIGTKMKLQLRQSQHNQRRVTKMQAKAEECRLWSDVCELGRGWLSNRFVLLCVVPDRPAPSRDEVVDNLRSKLQGSQVPLRGWLEQASELCTAIIENTLPLERLMIDNWGYHQRSVTIDEDSFRAYVSINPHFSLPIPASHR